MKEAPWSYLAQLEAARPNPGSPFGILSLKRLTRVMAGKRPGAGLPRHPVIVEKDPEPSKFWNSRRLAEAGFRKVRAKLSGGRRMTWIEPIEAEPWQAAA